MKRAQSNNNPSPYKISSPNDWFNKIGVKIDRQGNMALPMKIIILPVATASESLEKYKDDLLWSEKTKITQSIALNIRNADTAYFNAWSASIIYMNPTHPNSFPCRQCFITTMSPASLRAHVTPKLHELRHRINNEIIHSTENGRLILPDAVKTAVSYYNEFIKLNLFRFDAVEALPIKFCRKHVLTKTQNAGKR